MNYEFHEAANIFPLLEGNEFETLKQSIKNDGLKNPIWLYEGKIIDGRNRYRACQELGIEPTYIEWNGDGSLLSFVVAQNIARRHLDSSQLAKCAVTAMPLLIEEARQRMVAGAIQTNTGTQIIEYPEELGEAADHAAEMFHTNRQYIYDALNLQKNAPDLFESIGSEVPEKKEEKEEKTDDSSSTKNKKPRAKKKKKAKKLTIPQAKRELTKRQRKESPPLPTDKYRVFYADPPWKYGNDGVIGDTDHYGHVGRHYPSMSIKELCELPIKELAEDSAVLFLWVTSPLLAECWPIIKAWGFEYKTSFVWDKIKHNFGHYNSVRHEFLLICVRGSCTPDIDEKIPSVQHIERSEVHSQKPEEFRHIIDKMYPHGRRIELFARIDVEGWESWGNEPG